MDKYFNRRLPLWPRGLLSSLLAAKNAGWCRARAYAPGETEPEFTHRRILSKMCVAAQSNLAKFLGRAIKGLPPFASYQCVPGSRRFTNRSTVQRTFARFSCPFETKNRQSVCRQLSDDRDTQERREKFRGNRTISQQVVDSSMTSSNDSNF